MCLLSIGLGIGGVIGTGAAIAGAIGEALGVAGTAVGLTGSLIAADQQQAALDFEAEQTEANRKIYEQQALDIGEQGEWEKRNLALKQRAELAGQMASAAGSGVLLNYGSNLTLQEDQTQTDLLDMKQLGYDIASRQYQARLGAWHAQNQLNSLDAQRANAGTTGLLGMTGAAISGLGGIFSGAASGIALGDKIDARRASNATKGLSGRGSYWDYGTLRGTAPAASGDLGWNYVSPIGGR